ncbi:MAG: SpoIIE family protein phosphatase [Bacteroidetes bacterium]|nr:SpoIIE family protein phosphatase [Bacteroidota bacterium]
MRKAVVNTILLLVLPLFLLCENYNFDVLNSDKGLSQNSVTSIIKDAQGFMWFGTQDGLNRFDGQEVKIFKHNPIDSNSLSSNDIRALFQDSEGILWVGTSDGLNAFDLAVNKIVRYTAGKNNLTDSKISCVTQDKAGIIWVGTENGISLINKKEKTIKQLKLGENCGGCNNITTIAIKHKVWVGTKNSGLFSLDINNRVTKISLNLNKDGKEYGLNALCFYDNEILLISTDNGLLFFNSKQEAIISSISTKTSAEIISSEFISIQQDKNKTIFASTRSGDFYKLHFTDFKIEKIDLVDYSVLRTGIYSSFIDEESNIWLGTSSLGVVYHLDRKSYFNTNLFSEPIYSILKQNENNILVSGASNLSIIDSRGRIIKQTPQSNFILSFYNEGDGIIVGTYSGGVKFLNKDKLIRDDIKYYRLKDVTITEIKKIFADKLFLSTITQGLYIHDFNTNTFSSLNATNGLTSNFVNCFIKDKSNNIWIGTDKGVSIYNPQTNKFRYITTTSNKISSNYILTIHEDKRGAIWLGTDLGLNKVDVKTNTITQYYQKDGLPNDIVYGILEDEFGNLWLSTNNGICKFNPSIQNTNGSAFTCFTKEDGLQSNEFNQGAYYKAEDGELFFGGSKGFTSFYPKDIKTNTTPPTIFLADFKVNYRDFNIDSAFLFKKDIKLSHTQNHLIFTIKAIDYVKPQGLRYSVILEGHEKEWSPYSFNTLISYPQLPPGDYVFKVRAINNNGVEAIHPLEIRISITPPWYKTKLAYAFFSLTIALLFVGYTQGRTFKIRREKRILEERVADRTRQLAQKNRDITSSIQYAKKIQEAILPDRGEISGYFNESFILYKPKDIVSGDFYWFAEKNGKKIVAVVDCTGHGVPGAFMSMIGYNLLNQIVIEEGTTHAHEILNKLHKGVQKSLKQAAESDRHDGMDAAICILDEAKKEMQFAGANRPLVRIVDGKLEKITGNKYPIGGAQMQTEREFTLQTFTYKKGDCYYLFSDGYADQFGGDLGKKFMQKKLVAMLQSIHQNTMDEQLTLLDKEFSNWKGINEQVDDVLVIGIRT